MEILTDKKIINELQIALTYYIRGISISSLSNDWTSPIQRIIEHALLKYTTIDIRKGDFIELTEVKICKTIIKLSFSNKNCKYATEVKEISVTIPYEETIKNSYTLKGNIKVKIIQDFNKKEDWR